jgi:raffinose/stachyose/melibiose transport system substrate-binding protein
MQQLIDTFDLLLEYNINGGDPLGAVYEQDPLYLVDGEAAIWFNGSWAWANLLGAGAQPTDEYGFLPFYLGNDTSDFANNGIPVLSAKQIAIDRAYATDEQIEAAKVFLNWLTYNETAQQMLGEQAEIVSAFPNNQFAPNNPLAMDQLMKIQNGQVFPAVWGLADQIAGVGPAMQKYMGGASS